MLTTVIPAFVAAVGALAGQLDPPAGPVEPTMKTLDQIEARTPINDATTPGDSNAVYVISEPGSYYLTEDLQGVAGDHGIEITAFPVTLDLNGFSVIGPGGSSLNGIEVNVTDADGVIVQNGSIRGWGDDGLSLGTSSGAAIIRDIISSENGEHGFAGGDGAAQYLNCIAIGNEEDGFNLGSESLVTGCSAISNTGRGFASEGAPFIVESRAVTNGDIGIELAAGSVTRCQLRDNTNVEIMIGGPGLIQDSLIATGESTGISVDDGVVVRGNQLFGGGAGTAVLVTGSGSSVERNHASNWTTAYSITGTNNSVCANISQGVTNGVTGDPMNAVGVLRSSYVGSGPWDNFQFP